MKVAIVHDFLIEYGGAEKVLADLLELYPKADLYTLFYDQKKLGQFFDKHNPKVTYLQKYPKLLKGAFLRPFCPAAIESFSFEDYDLVISNCNSFAKGIITPPNVPHICYNHSPTRYLWDYHHKYLQEHGIKNFKGLLIKPIFSYLRLWDFNASKRVNYYIANSINVKKRIEKFYHRDSKVVYPGTDIKDFKNNTKGNYFLLVSRLSKYKRVDLAVKAFNKLNHKLIIIGAGPERKNLEKLAKNNIKFLGFKDDGVVQSYFSRARAFIFPQEEDFGLTPIEAMASGVPVIAFRKGGALETIKDGLTGVFFEQQTAGSLGKAIEQFVEIEKGFQPKKIQEHAQQFSIQSFQKDFKQAVNTCLDDFKNKQN